MTTCIVEAAWSNWSGVYMIQKFRLGRDVDSQSVIFSLEYFKETRSDIC